MDFLKWYVPIGIAIYTFARSSDALVRAIRYSTDQIVEAIRARNF